MGAIACLIPFLVVFEPGLVMRSFWGNVAWVALTGVMGVYFATGTFQGFVGRSLQLAASHPGLSGSPRPIVSLCCVH